MKRTIFLLGIAIVFLCEACDSGDIEGVSYAYSDKGYVVKLTGTLSGVDSWDSKYAVSLAGFTTGDNYAQTVRSLSPSTPDGTDVSLVLPNLNNNITTVELVITNRLRERIITIARINLDDYSNPRDTIHMEMGTIDVSAFNCLQQGLFNVACIQCHGGNGRSAANLNLTEGYAQNCLVDVPSTKVSDKYRVISGNAEQSLLHQILNEGGEDILHYNHTEVLSSQFKDNLTEIRSLIDEWINKLNFED